MLVLDENLPASQKLLLRKSRIHFRVIGEDLADRGTDDQNLLPVLRRLARPTFLTLDRDFYRRDWMHESYSLVWLDVSDAQAAEFIRRFLKHGTFNTHAKRMGTIARVQVNGILYWRIGRRSVQSAAWIAD